MDTKLESKLYRLKAFPNEEEMLLLADDLIKELIKHFYNKAQKSKKLYELYKYGSILLAAITTIVASIQVIYSESFRHGF